MWTLILTLIISGHSVHTVAIPNLSNREICRQIGENHIEHYKHKFKTFSSSYAGVYTCVEQKQ